MANFGITNSTGLSAQGATAATYTLVNLVMPSTAGASYNAAGGTVSYPKLTRGKVYDLLVGTNGTPADNFVEWQVNRITVASTATWTTSISSVSANFALDQADQGFGSFATANCSVAGGSSTVCGTFGTVAWYVGVNQRASYRWVAAPGSELVWPAQSTATSSGGFALSARSGGYTGTVTGTMLFQEQ